MKKLTILALAAMMVLGVVGTAFAENGPVLPWASVKSVKYKPAENGPVLPW